MLEEAYDNISFDSLKDRGEVSSLDDDSNLSLSQDLDELLFPLPMLVKKKESSDELILPPAALVKKEDDVKKEKSMSFDDVSWISLSQRSDNLPFPLPMLKKKESSVESFLPPAALVKKKENKSMISLDDDSRISLSQRSDNLPFPLPILKTKKESPTESILPLAAPKKGKEREKSISFSVGRSNYGIEAEHLTSSSNIIGKAWFSHSMLSPVNLRKIGSYMDKIVSLESVMTEHAVDNMPLVFLHANEERDLYTDDEMLSLPERDFQTRIFVTALSIQNNSLWLRNHHTDNVKSATNFTYIRDYFKAAYSIKNHSAAKATLTSTLNKWFNLNSDQYYTFATTLASGLSNEAINTSFQIENDLVESIPDLKHARRIFILLMDILFKRIHLKTFLYTDNNSNIYRLAHCMTKNSRKKSPLVYASFSFLLQLALTGFVLMSSVFSDSNAELSDATRRDSNDYEEIVNFQRKLSMHALALFGFAYTIMVASKEFLIAGSVYRFYGKITVLAFIDFFVNLLLPTILLFAGYFVIANELSFINAVLNTTAFLFIPEIDDRLPGLLNYDQEALIENYLIAESKNTYNEFIMMDRKDINAKFDDMKNDDSPLGVPFNDYYITNDMEEGSNQTNGSLYQPHSVVKNEELGHEIDPSNYVTRDCLLKSVEWKYTTFSPKTTKPRVGYLKLVKLNGEVVEIKYKGKEAMDVGKTYRINGVFVITNFVMSCGILNLRLCGSESGSDSARDFMKAFDYYSLWDIDFQARNLLNKDVQHEYEGGYFQSAKSLFFRSSRKRRSSVPQDDEYDA